MGLREINLVPPDMLFPRKVRRHLFFWVGCLLIAIALIFTLHLYQRSVLMKQKRPLLTLQDTHTHLGATIEEVKRIQEELERLHEQQAVLESISRHQSHAGVLATIAEILNRNTWLRELAIEQGDDKQEIFGVTLTGYSFSNDDVGDFISRLSNEAIFDRVILKYAKDTPPGGVRQYSEEDVKLIQFKVECTISIG